MRASFGPGASGGAVSAAAVGLVLGAAHPANVNRRVADANMTAANNFIFMELIYLALLRPNVTQFVQKESFLECLVQNRLQNGIAFRVTSCQNPRPKIFL